MSTQVHLDVDLPTVGVQHYPPDTGHPVFGHVAVRIGDGHEMAFVCVPGRELRTFAAELRRAADMLDDLANRRTLALIDAGVPA